jgi:hypothetical protein
MLNFFYTERVRLSRRTLYVSAGPIAPYDSRRKLSATTTDSYCITDNRHSAFKQVFGRQQFPLRDDLAGFQGYTFDPVFHGLPPID